MDKITYEIIRSGLYAVAREMKIAMMRTAASPIIHSGGDASAAIFDANMQLVAQGNDIPTMLGSAVISTRASVEAIGIEKLRPGDVILSNDVYLGGGNHQPDVQFTRPIFLDGKIIAFSMTRGHWSDIGGQAPGSFTPDTWDIFGEGIRIPPVLLYRNDEPVGDLLNLIVQNTRDPASRVLDIKAQYAGTYVGDRRIVALARKYGPENLRQAMAESLDHSERLMRAQIARIPDGVYEAGDLVEPVGAEADLIPIKVKVTVAGERMIFDFTGTAKQVRGGINCPFAVTCNSTWFTVKAITDAAIPINQGCYRPIEIIVPEGTVLNCTYPASVVSGNTETSPRVIDLLLRALAQAVPERVIGQSHCAACSGIFSGEDPDNERSHALRRRYVSFIDVHAGGMGARSDKDGVNAIRVYVGNTGATPVELIEHTTPLRLEEWAIVPDTGGPGRWRGGLAARRTYRVLYEEATCTVIAERGRVAPAGVLGGKAGTCFVSIVEHADGRRESLPAKGKQAVLGAGDRVSIQPAGAGGYGDPLQRPAELVLEDVVNGYVSAAAAEASYGVVIAKDGRSLDAAATARRRAKAGV
ncbi:MAG TPA: hydantoinase B/oxoprolinase family protein [Stellaceae bacterium]|nr:hydantoinase B/oxoprolinase family protein [Stellaceae bacterium]